MRYLRLYANFLRFSFSRAMEFRLDFFFRIVMDLLYYVINIGFYKVVFLHTDLIGGWNDGQMMVFVGCFLLFDAVNMTVLANNLWLLPEMINKGDLDYYMVRPVSSLFFTSLRDFAANSFVNLLMAAAFLGWAIWHLGAAVNPANVLFLVLMLGLGLILRYCLRMLTIIPVFWIHSGRGLEMVFFNLSRFVERPDRIYTGVMRVVLTSLLPFGIMVSYPARLFLEPFRWQTFAHLTLMTLVFAFITGFLWSKGLRAYSSASS
jgi:ABC-2 type transport system permease protein